MPLRSWSIVLSLIAVVMLVIAGGPAVAAPHACDPCPPDCPMMAELAAKAAAAHESGAPADQQSDNPCKQMAACPSSTAAAPPLLGEGFRAVFTAGSARHGWLTVLAIPSRPPDRTLRPPIQL